MVYMHVRVEMQDKSWTDVEFTDGGPRYASCGLGLDAICGTSTWKPRTLANAGNQEPGRESIDGGADS